MNNFILGIAVGILIDTFLFTDVNKGTHLDRIEIVALDACIKGVVSGALEENVDCKHVASELRKLEEK